MKLKPVTSKQDIRLTDGDATIAGAKSGGALVKAIVKETDRIGDLQRVLYADGRYALLIVLQGRDAAGKDGTIRKVFSAVNPQGCTVASFRAPTDVENEHDFLWRIHQQVPPRRMIGIFNRSHYEDILVPRVHDTLPKKVWSARYDQINDFEHMLTENGVIVLKFLLHISRDEQKQRLQDRLTHHDKNWKFRAEDLDDRRRWDDYTKAYRAILEHTSTKRARWYIVPADDKSIRDWLIARTIADTLEALKLRYPAADPAILDLRVE